MFAKSRLFLVSVTGQGCFISISYIQYKVFNSISFDSWAQKVLILNNFIHLIHIIDSISKKWSVKFWMVYSKDNYIQKKPYKTHFQKLLIGLWGQTLPITLKSIIPLKWLNEGSSNILTQQKIKKTFNLHDHRSPYSTPSYIFPFTPCTASAYFSVSHMLISTCLKSLIHFCWYETSLKETRFKVQISDSLRQHRSAFNRTTLQINPGRETKNYTIQIHKKNSQEQNEQRFVVSCWEEGKSMLFLSIRSS